MRPAISYRRPTSVLMGLLALLAVITAVFAVHALAYNGEFCYGIHLDVHKDCYSNVVTKIRRAVGHGKDYTGINVSNSASGSRGSYCYSDGCTADTGYLAKDGKGTGGILNNGDPCNCGGGDYYGWLYP